MQFFKLSEFDCPCCGACEMDSVLLERVDNLRRDFGRPLNINSAFRCPAHNKDVGGKSTSQHLVGKACDVSTANMTKAQRAELIKMVRERFNGVGVATTFVHVDVRGYRAFWIY